MATNTNNASSEATATATNTTPSSTTSDGVWIGIDFGTSNSTCAVWDSTRGSPKWIRLPNIAPKQSSNGKMGRIVPSIVAYSKTNSNDHPPTVGAQAVSASSSSNTSPSLVKETEETKKNQEIEDDVDNVKSKAEDDRIVLHSIKRFLGQTMDDLDPEMLSLMSFGVEGQPKTNGEETNTDEDEELVLVLQDINDDETNGNDTDDIKYEDCLRITPVEGISVILKSIREAAQLYLDKYSSKKYMQIPYGNDNKTIRNVVVGVPAHFSKRQCGLIEEACRLAGFPGHVSTCLESTAAAMAYGLTMQEQSNKANIMVIDMGGGTTDITIATKQTTSGLDESDYTIVMNQTTNTTTDGTNNNDNDNNNNTSSYKVLVTQGDEHLGGDDIDQAMMEYCKQQLEKTETTTKVGEKKEKMTSSTLRKACRQAKELLCQQETTSESIQIDSNHQVEINQETFQTILEPWLEQARTLIQSTLDQFHEQQQQPGKALISEVILVGGTTRVPAIRKCIQEFFPNLELCTSLNPMSSVAMGLAIQAAVQSKLIPMYELKSALMLDCVPHAIGVELPNGNFVEIIPRNTPLPAVGSATFTLADKYQKGVTIKASELVGESKSGELKFEPMSKEDFTFLLRRLEPKEFDAISSRSIQVGMKVDTEGRFIVSIYDELDPEQRRKKERYELEQKNGKQSSSSPPSSSVGELEYITELVFTEAGVTTEQFLLTGMLIGVLVLYIAVKLAFNEPAEDATIL